MTVCEKTPQNPSSLMFLKLELAFATFSAGQQFRDIKIPWRYLLKSTCLRQIEIQLENM